MTQETALELAASQLVKREAPTSSALLADDNSQHEDFAGVEFIAATRGIISHGAGNSKVVSEMSLTISIRSLIPTLDAPATADLWKKIETAILHPTPLVSGTWVQAIPALANFSLFSALGETTSDRTDDDDRRRHTRTFKVLTSPA